MQRSEMASAMQEIAGLEALETQMAQNLTGLKQQQSEAKFARTLSGRVFNFGGGLFAIYCVYRICIVRTFCSWFGRRVVDVCCPTDLGQSRAALESSRDDVSEQ